MPCLGLDSGPPSQKVQTMQDWPPPRGNVVELERQQSTSRSLAALTWNALTLAVRQRRIVVISSPLLKPGGSSFSMIVRPTGFSKVRASGSAMTASQLDANHLLADEPQPSA